MGVPQTDKSINNFTASVTINNKQKTEILFSHNFKYKCVDLLNV